MVCRRFGLKLAAGVSTDDLQSLQSLGVLHPIGDSAQLLS